MQSARLGLVIGKKAIALAHDRNRAKRIIRSRFRQSRHVLGSVDLVVRVVARSYDQDLHRALDALFMQLEKQALEDSAAS